MGRDSLSIGYMEGIDDLIFEDGEFQASLARKVLSYLSSRQRTGYTTSGLYYSYHQADVTIILRAWWRSHGKGSTCRG